MAFKYCLYAFSVFLHFDGLLIFSITSIDLGIESTKQTQGQLYLYYVKFRYVIKNILVQLSNYILLVLHYEPCFVFQVFSMRNLY